MSLGIKLEAVKGLPHGQTGDRVARVIFRGGHDIMIMMMRMTEMLMIVQLVTES